MIETTLAADVTAARPVPAVPATTTLRDAAVALVAGGIGAVAVLGEDGKLQGLLSGDDIVGFLVAGEDLEETSAGDVVVGPVDLLSPEDTRFDALALMVLRGVTHLPVLDGDRLVAILSARQLLHAAYHELDRGYMRVQTEVFGATVGEG